MTSNILMGTVIVLLSCIQLRGIFAFNLPPSTPSQISPYNNSRQSSNNGHDRIKRRQVFRSTILSSLRSPTNIDARNNDVETTGDEKIFQPNDDMIDDHTKKENDKTSGFDNIISSVKKKIGSIDDSRIAYPELYEPGSEATRMFSSLKYMKDKETGKVLSAEYVGGGSTISAIALIAGTTVGAGVLAIPKATIASGFLPSTAALTVAWWYMTMSGLLVSELSINRMGETGKTGKGLVDLYKNILGDSSTSNQIGFVLGGVSYFFLHYAIMVAYIAKGGANLEAYVTALPTGTGPLAFAGGVGLFLYASKPSFVEEVNKILFVSLAVAFVGVVVTGSGSADFTALIHPSNQHPENVVNSFPVLFSSLLYQNVVPTVVTQLEGDKRKITQAVVAGTTLPFLMFVVWNSIILGNVIHLMNESGIGSNVIQQGFNPVGVLLQATNDNTVLGGNPPLGAFVNTFSEIALITSFIGFVYGLMDALTDVIPKVPSSGPKFESYKPLLFAIILVPSIVVAMYGPGSSNPEKIFYNTLDYAGSFGVSTLFLVLPPIMVWNERYGEKQKPLITKPIAPFGKITLAGLWKAALTLIVEQGLEKLGVIEFVRDKLPF